jgi:glycosyltransferase involved in cell wall biosynthesis
MTGRSRLLLIDQFGTIGGGQTVLLSLLHPAQDVFKEVGVLAPAGPLQDAVQDQAGGKVAFHCCEEPRLTHGGKGMADLLGLIAYAWRFRRHIGLLKAQDVIYVNGLRHLPFMLAFSLLARTRVIYHVHLVHSRVERWLIWLASRWRGTICIVASSNFVASRLRIGDKIRVIHNALGRDFARRTYVNRFAAPGWRMAVVGTLRPEKGQDIAMAAVRDRADATLYLIGQDGSGAEHWIEDLKARRQANVIFHGTARNVAECLDALDIQINLVPSQWQEAFGLAAIEGMASSCVTLVSGAGGLREIASDTGAIVARTEPELAQAIDKLCGLPPARLDALAREQFEATQRAYAPERFEREVCELLYRAAGDGPAPGECANSRGHCG